MERMPFMEAMQKMLRRVGILIVICGCGVISAGVLDVSVGIESLPIAWLVLFVIGFIIAGLAWLVITGYLEGAFVNTPQSKSPRLTGWIFLRMGVPILLLIVMCVFKKDAVGFGLIDVIFGIALAISGLWIISLKIPSIEVKGGSS